MKVELSADVIVQAGVELAAEAGLEAVGIRSVAARLGVTPMALYRYIGTGEALGVDVLEAILDTMPVVATEGPWSDRYRAWARETRVMLAGYPGLARHLLIHCFELRPMLRLIESLLAVAADAGLTGFEGVAAANVVMTYVLMRAEFEQAVRTSRPPGAPLALLESGSLDLPLLQANAEHYVGNTDRHFEHGLDSIIAGLELRRVAVGAER